MRTISNGLLYCVGLCLAIPRLGPGAPGIAESAAAASPQSQARSSQTNNTQAALREMILPQEEYRQARIRDVLAHLIQNSRQQDPGGEGLHLRVTLARPATRDLGTAVAQPDRETRISLALRDVTYMEVVTKVAQAAGYRYTVSDDAIIIESTNEFDVLPEATHEGGADRTRVSAIPAERVKCSCELLFAHPPSNQTSSATTILPASYPLRLEISLGLIQKTHPASFAFARSATNGDVVHVSMVRTGDLSGTSVSIGDGKWLSYPITENVRSNHYASITLLHTSMFPRVIPAGEYSLRLEIPLVITQTNGVKEAFAVKKDVRFCVEDDHGEAVTEEYVIIWAQQIVPNLNPYDYHQSDLARMRGELRRLLEEAKGRQYSCVVDRVAGIQAARLEDYETAYEYLSRYLNDPTEKERGEQWYLALRCLDLACAKLGRDNPFSKKSPVRPNP